VRKDHQYDYLRLYAKYIGLTIQMIIILLLGGFGGKALDDYLKSGSSVYAILFIIIAAIVSFYLFFKALFTK
jgi:hypothetical protein